MPVDEIDYYRDPYWIIDANWSDVNPRWIVVVPFKYQGKKGMATGMTSFDPAYYPHKYQKIVDYLKRDLPDMIRRGEVRGFELQQV